jgi:hypothetical protein
MSEKQKTSATLEPYGTGYIVKWTDESGKEDVRYFLGWKYNEAQEFYFEKRKGD